MAQAGSDLQMTGIASYTELRRPYYIGALYLDQPVVSAGQVLSSWGERRMEMRITAQRWTPRRFSSQWTQALILNVDPGKLAKYDDAFVQFNNLPHQSLTYGDHIVVESDKKGRTRVSLNGTEMFTESKPGFFEVLLATWIGPKPPSSEFKAAILGNVDAAIVAEYDALHPTPERKREIASWLEEGGASSEAAAEEQVAATEQSSDSNAAAAAAAAAATAAAATSEAVSATAPAGVTEEVAAIVQEVDVTDAVEEPPVEPVQSQPEPATVVAMAPTAAAMVEEEPEIDPEIYRLQQETLLKLYRSAIIKRALRQVKYPKSAVRRNQQGVVGLELTVNRAGQMVSLAKAEPSRFKSLNAAAEAAVYDAGALPPVPAGLEGELITVSIPVKFTLE